MSKLRGLRGELLKGPDQHGRYSYFLYWLDNYFPGHPEGEYVERERGQVFFGVPPKDIKKWTDSRQAA